MILRISAEFRQAMDLGYVFFKHPNQFQRFRQSFGDAYVFYPKVQDHLCQVCLLLDVDPVKAAQRIKSLSKEPSLSQYVNDLPFASCSFLSVAIGSVFRSAMSGQSKERQDMAETEMKLTAEIAAVAIRGSDQLADELFEPLGYQVLKEKLEPKESDTELQRNSPYCKLKIAGKTTISSLLNHLYILLPVLDRTKHYYVDQAEVAKLIEKASDWLKSHPKKEFITGRFLKFQKPLVGAALDQLSLDEESIETAHNKRKNGDEEEIEDQAVKDGLSLNQVRHQSVVDQLKTLSVRSVLDLGCSDGKLLKRIRDEKEIPVVAGCDVSTTALKWARQRLSTKFKPFENSKNCHLFQGSATVFDHRMKHFDAIVLVEVIEHLEAHQLRQLSENVFGKLQNRNIIITTPNRDFNSFWESLPAGSFRHGDHRFEFNQKEFRVWCESIGRRFGYQITYHPIGDDQPNLGPPTQMAVFEKLEENHGK